MLSSVRASAKTRRRDIANAVTGGKELVAGSLTPAALGDMLFNKKKRGTRGPSLKPTNEEGRIYLDKRENGSKRLKR